MNPSKGQPAPRRYGFACLMCRRRKIKCDGKKPNCANCIKAKEICSYKESPSYNVHLVHQLQQSKKRIEDLESQMRVLVDLDHDERRRRLADIVRDFDHLSMASTSPSQMTELSQSYDTDGETGGENLPYGKPADFSVGEHGTVSLLGIIPIRTRSWHRRDGCCLVSDCPLVLWRDFAVSSLGFHE